MEAFEECALALQDHHPASSSVSALTRHANVSTQDYSIAFA
eukprot:CAMPEP_0114493558 /NCGR_PEP_ID=MMETSP0109-20121206/4172_1 /TAXON_ID=29199 /ORGANISM="Chlorarachnion reptans, Strain CCCM449" /LENGTH=40 /DNA_ID= /DNA_START= /DNA_END= /DNA_ORIENTATION=